MSDTVIVALISAGSTMLTAIVALVLNHRAWNSLERRIETIEKDLKEFFRLMAEYDKRLTRLEDKGK